MSVGMVRMFTPSHCLHYDSRVKGKFQLNFTKTTSNVRNALHLSSLIRCVLFKDFVFFFFLKKKQLKFSD